MAHLQHHLSWLRHPSSPPNSWGACFPCQCESPQWSQDHASFCCLQEDSLWLVLNGPPSDPKAGHGRSGVPRGPPMLGLQDSEKQRPLYPVSPDEGRGAEMKPASPSSPPAGQCSLLPQLAQHGSCPQRPGWVAAGPLCKVGAGRRAWSCPTRHHLCQEHEPCSTERANWVMW